MLNSPTTLSGDTALINYQHNPTGINLFLAIVQGIFLAIALVTLVFAAVNFVQSLKAVSTFSSTSSLSQGADKGVAGTSDDVLKVSANKADFTDDAWNEIQGLSKNANGETISNSASGRKIHEGFKTDLPRKSIKGAGRTTGKYGFTDAFDDSAKIIYELKPNNSKSIQLGIKQLNRYNRALGGNYKMVLVLY